MANKYWIKAWHEILDDPKMGRLPNNLWRRFFECCLLAGEMGYEDDDEMNGRLPSVGDMTWRLRIDEETLLTELEELARKRMLEYRSENVLDGYWFVTHFNERQRKMTKAEYMRRLRSTPPKVTDQLQPSYQSVTNGNTEREDERERDKERDKEVLAAPAAAYAEFLHFWNVYFSDKPQPRPDNKTLQGKFKTRMKSTHFQENWQAAIERAGKSTFLHGGSWFTAQWFLKNDDNYEKCLNGNYDDGISSNGQGNGRQPSRPIPESEETRVGGVY